MSDKALTVTMASTRGLVDRHAFLSARMLSMVTGISQNTLAAALRGQKYLGAEREAKLLTITQQCANIIEALLPLRLYPGDGHTLKMLVRSGRDPETIRSMVLSMLESVE